MAASSDYLPLYAETKGLAEDLSEGKFSFPIAHAIRTDKYVMKLLQTRPSTAETKRAIIAYMDIQTNSFEYTRNVLKQLEEQAMAEIERLGGNPKLISILEALSKVG